MLRQTRLLNRSVLRSITLTALVGAALTAVTACADSSTAPKGDCGYINNIWVCWP